MDDRGLVESLRTGGSSALAAVYDAYATRLYSYARSLVQDRDAAADVVHDTLLIARERIAALRDPEKFRPWLYAIARNECLRFLRDRNRGAPLDEVAARVIDDSVDVGAGLRADELRELVWAAAAALNPGDREVLELSLRHDLAGADLAAALGVSTNSAHAMSSRARTQLGRALAALIVARTGRANCAELSTMLTGWDGVLTPLLRKRLVRHVDGCDTCSAGQRERVNPAALLAGVPFLIAPAALRDRVVRDAHDHRLVSYGQSLANRAGPWFADGFPKPLAKAGKAMFAAEERPAAMKGRWPAAVAALVLGAALVLAGILSLRATPTETTAESGAPPTSSLDAGQGTTGATATGTAATTPSGSPTTGASPTAAATTLPSTGIPPRTTVPGVPELTTAAGPATTTTARPAPPAGGGTTRTTRPPVRTTNPPPTRTPTRPMTVSVSHSADPAAAECPDVWTFNLVATVRNATATSVTANVTGPTGAPEPQRMASAGNGTWTTSVTLKAGEQRTWTATATGANSSVTSGSDTLGYSCPQVG